jgi:uracil phosphoribosyltransferase|tara:strand:+ start:1223 stop:1873 length:651 start_codon:yes stop_codon:yes gene_type:complete
MKNKVTILQSRPISYLLNKLRNKNTNNKDFVIYGDRLMKILAEEVLCRLPNIKIGLIETPCGKCNGLINYEHNDISVVSIIRAGDSMLKAFRSIQPDISVGKILIQRDEQSENKDAVLYYKKLPKNISNKIVILVDPMIATGGSALKAISVLLDNGAVEKQIIFANIISCSDGIANILEKYPNISIITSTIDKQLDNNKYIIPGLGDFGDRYYGTN